MAQPALVQGGLTVLDVRGFFCAKATRLLQTASSPAVSSAPKPSAGVARWPSSIEASQRGGASDPRTLQGARQLARQSPPPRRDSRDTSWRPKLRHELPGWVSRPPPPQWRRQGSLSKDRARGGRRAAGRGLFQAELDREGGRQPPTVAPEGCAKPGRSARVSIEIEAH